MTLVPVTENIMCPYCKRPVDAKLEHPIRWGDWMIRCEDCDVWSVVTIKVSGEKR